MSSRTCTKCTKALGLEDRRDYLLTEGIPPDSIPEDRGWPALCNRCAAEQVDIPFLDELPELATPAVESEEIAWRRTWGAA